MRLNPTPWEPALLRDVARCRIGDAGAGQELLYLEFLEAIVDHRARGFGGKAVAPAVDAEPIAEFGRVRLLPIDADHANGLKIALDQEYGLAAGVGLRGDELHGVIVQIGVRQAAGIFGDAAVIGEMRDGFYVR